MVVKCEAIVEKGLLRPLRDLGLNDADHVLVTVERIDRGESARKVVTPAQLASAAKTLLRDYAPGGELAAFAVLDGEDFSAEG